MYEVTKMCNTITLSPKEDKPAILSINEEDRQVVVNGQACPLTQQEYSLLILLIEHLNQPVSREELLRIAWGYVCPGATRTVDVHVQRLRKKIGCPCIETVYRHGYKLRAAPV